MKKRFPRRAHSCVAVINVRDGTMAARMCGSAGIARPAADKRAATYVSIRSNPLVPLNKVKRQLRAAIAHLVNRNVRTGKYTAASSTTRTLRSVAYSVTPRRMLGKQDG